VILLALRDYFIDPHRGGVTLDYATHPVHGDVLERAGRTLAGRLDDLAD
jgi:hypothetical protein